MSNSIVPQNSGDKPMTFKFDEDEIRIVKDETGEPIFVASDVCKALGLEQVSKAVAGLNENEKGLTKVTTPSGIQSMVFITESGLYRLVYRSNKPNAEKFREWVLKIIKAVRETGFYAAPNLSPFQIMRQMIDTLESQQQQITEVKHDVAEIKAHIQTEVEYFTVIGYCRKTGLSTPSQNEAQSIGIRATKLSKDKGYSIGNTSDARYGTVHTYHVSVLKEVIGR